MNGHVPPSSFGGAIAVLDRFRQPSATDAGISDINIEQALIGCVLMHPHVFPGVEALVATEHFSEEAHRAVWSVLSALAAAGDTPNLLRLRGAIGGEAWSRDFGGKTFGRYLTDLAGMGMPLHAAEYARTVQQLWQIRELQAAAGAVVAGNGIVPGPALEGVYARIDEIRASFVARKPITATIDQAGEALVRGIQEDLQGTARPLPGSGIALFDREIGGAPQPSSLVTVAARTSMGKSVFGVEVADAMASQGYAALYHSLEMSRRQVAARIAASALERRGVRMPFEQILRRGGLDQRQAETVARIMAERRDHPLTIEDGGGRTIGEIAASSDRLANGYARRGIALGCVVIDHAHIVRASRAYRREDEGLKEVADGALALAKHLDCPVFLLAQCNRQTEGREDKRPQLADIRGAGAFEENSDAVVFLYRPAYYVERSQAYRDGDPDAQDAFDKAKHDLEIIIDKNRAGRANQIVRAWIDPALNAIRNLQGSR